VDGSRNAKLAVVDCSAGVNVLEKPTGKVDASMGDVHPLGNPHYWLDPRNGGWVAKNAAEAFARADPANAAAYRARAAGVRQRGPGGVGEARAAREGVALAPGVHLPPLVAVLRRRIRPGSGGHGRTRPRHPAHRAASRRAGGAGESATGEAPAQEPYFASDSGHFLEREAGVHPVVQATSCAEPKAGSYLKHFDEILTAMEGSAR
jgi:zinc/manganese transport system substrate-binding protein